MKKVLSLILALILLVSCLISCENSSSETEHTHQFSDADCKSPKSCECGATEGARTQTHSFENGVCTICGKTLINELSRLIYENKVWNVDQGLSYSENNGDTNCVYMRISEGIATEVVFHVTVTMTQDGITSGLFEWEIKRNTYIKDKNQYDSDIIKGTIATDKFSASAGLSVTEVDGLSDGEVSEYTQKASRLIDKAIKQYLAVGILGNKSGLTVADFGFKNYQ